MRRAVPVVAGVVLLLATGCSGVPSSSKPELIKEVAGAVQPGPAVAAPALGADPTAIVSGFLAANVDPTDSAHLAARQYLTRDAAAKWSDKTATVVSGTPQIGVLDTARSAVPVSITPVGTVQANGVYVPAAASAPASPDGTALSFGLTRVSGQWRISQVPVGVGVIIEAADLGSSSTNVYVLHPLYFLDTSGKHLVADPRYTPLKEAALDKWLLDQLRGGPRQDLAGAVQPLPDKINLRGADVTPGTPLSVELPGSSQLDADARTRLASQLANTFAQNAQPMTVVITDGGRVVQYNDQLLAPFGSLSNPPLFFLGRDGSVRQLNGQPVDGVLSKPSRLSSIAVAQAPKEPTNYLVAGVAANGAASSLLVGSMKAGLHGTSLSGPLTRPTWAEEQSEVWVGNGPTLWRLPVGSRPVRVPISYSTGQAPQIRAIRISPDGSRIALVLAASGGTATVYISTIIRQGGSVQVSAPTPVTPSNVDITDVDWNDETTLYVIGVAPGGSGFGVWSVQQDGSAWADRSRQGLPSAPQSIAAAPGAVSWVSAGGAVYSQKGVSGRWVSAVGAVDVPVAGTAPTFLE